MMLRVCYDPNLGFGRALLVLLEGEEPPEGWVVLLIPAEIRFFP